jgi:3-oxoacyl-[acyl-carrier protein] reductase
MTSKKVAIVTGGHRGIGLAIARKLAQGGFDLAITGPFELGVASTVVSDLRSLGREIIYVKSDLALVEGHQETVERIRAELGPISCLVNNAGIAPVVRGDFLDLRPDNFDLIVSVNLRGTIFFTQAVVASMLAASGEERSRSIINITSINAIMTSLQRIDYCVTKAGLSAFTAGLALRLAESGIAVFEVRPGIVKTDMTAQFSERYTGLINEGVVPMRRWGMPEDIARVVGSLTSGDFHFATGSTIEADGGLSIARL